MKLIGVDNPLIVSWSVQKSLNDMEAGGVATAILSGNVPQVRPLAKEAATRIARESNEYAKQLAMDYPGCRIATRACEKSLMPSTRSKPTASEF